MVDIKKKKKKRTYCGILMKKCSRWHVLEEFEYLKGLEASLRRRMATFWYISDDFFSWSNQNAYLENSLINSASFMANVCCSLGKFVIATASLYS